LKIFDTYKHIFILILMVIFGSCVNDDSFFPEENNDVITSSASVVTTLYNFGLGNTILSENDQCFRFVYPITLGYNTDSSIRVDNYQGLVDVISSQRTNFNITGLQFPVQIVFRGNNTEVIISDEASLLNTVRECEFSTVRDEFDRFFTSCFKFEYPVTLLDANQNEVNVTTDQEFQTFYQSQGPEYQPNFKFPVNLLVSPDFESVPINTYFGFYRITESCERRCPQPSFTVENTDRVNLGYKFTAMISEASGLNAYDWLVNGQIIEADGANNQGDNLLLFNFEAPGVYEVCIKGETDTCPEGIEFCKSVEVLSVCPELFFEFEQEQGTFGYTFFANFEEINQINYEWFVDNEPIEQDGGAEGDNSFFTTLSIGAHTVCIKTMIPSCANELEFCEEIMVEEICPDLSFTFEQEGNTSSYNFTANFPDIETTQYQWLINGEVIEQDGGANGDNIFFFQFDPGTYNVCIFSETPTCPNGKEFCNEIVVQ